MIYNSESGPEIKLTFWGLYIYTFLENMEDGRCVIMVREIALCIPIYKTDYLAHEFLVNYSKSYLEMGIDIYYYDSTPDDSVKSVIDKWVDRSEEHTSELQSQR